MGTAGTPKQPDKKSSMQAMTIDKARDVGDESDNKGDAP